MIKISSLEAEKLWQFLTVTWIGWVEILIVKIFCHNFNGVGLGFTLIGALIIRKLTCWADWYALYLNFFFFYKNIYICSIWEYNGTRNKLGVLQQIEVCYNRKVLVSVNVWIWVKHNYKWLTYNTSEWRKHGYYRTSEMTVNITDYDTKCVISNILWMGYLTYNKHRTILRNNF